jgi:hypothetical protein
MDVALHSLLETIASSTVAGGEAYFGLPMPLQELLDSV